MRVALSHEVADDLKALAIRLGVSQQSLISLASEYATQYITENFTSFIETVSDPVKVTLPRLAPGMLYLTEVASRMDIPVGEVLNHLLREFLPIVLYNQDIRRQAERIRWVMAVNPMVLTKFSDIRCDDPNLKDLSNVQFIQYLIQDLSLEKLAELVVRSCTLSDRYAAKEYTTMSCPRQLASLLVDASERSNLKRGAVMSAFLDQILHWTRSINLSIQEIPINFDTTPVTDTDEFRNVLDYAFSLGYTNANRD